MPVRRTPTCRAAVSFQFFVVLVGWVVLIGKVLFTIKQYEFVENQFSKKAIKIAWLKSVLNRLDQQQDF